MALNPEQLANAIENAFISEWDSKKTTPLPAAGKKDREILFAAIARGVLKFLEDNEGNINTTYAVSGLQPHSHQLDF